MGEYIVHELDYDSTRSFGRVRENGSHIPLLVLFIDLYIPHVLTRKPLPWNIVHRIDETSPLYKATYRGILSRGTAIPQTQTE